MRDRPRAGPAFFSGRFRLRHCVLRSRRMGAQLTLAAFLLLTFTSAAGAEVTRVEIARRSDLGVSGYEKIVGTIHFAVDPKDLFNRGVVDLDKAPLNAAGRVEFSS